MKRTILLVLIGNREESAVKVQKVLTAWGCMIKTRLGIHDGVLDDCSDKGLLVLELVGKDEDKQEMKRKISVIPGVSTEMVDLELPLDA